MSFSRTSPTQYGLVPDAVTEVGGVVLDIVGASGVRVVAQLAASSLYEGFFPSQFGTIGSLTGITPELVTALGGGITEIAVRLTVYDADTASGNFDVNQNWLNLSGTRIQGFTEVTTIITDSVGGTNGNTRNGFGNETLDTGWFYNNDEAAMDEIFQTLETISINGGALDVQLEDVDPNDNYFDFSRGIDGSLVDIGSFSVIPVANDDAVTVTEDDAPIAIDVRANDVDTGVFDVTEIDGSIQPATVTLASGATLSLDANGDVVFDQNGAYQELRSGEEVVETVTYTVTDPEGGSDSAQLSITIQGISDAPDVQDDAFSLNEDTAQISGNLFADNGMGTDVDVDLNATFQITEINGQAGLVGTEFSLGDGLLTVGADGALTFKTDGGYEYLAAGESATESFSYTVTDDDGLTSTAQVSVEITGINDAPEAFDDTATTASDTAVNLAPLANDADPEGLPLQIVAINGAPVAGAAVRLTSGALLSVDAATPGGFIYDPDGAFDLAKDEVATDSFTYTIEDSEGAQSTATVSVEVVGPNTSPVAVDDTATVDEEGSVRIDVLANDSDADAGDTLTRSLVDGPDNGLLTINGDGSFTYIALQDFFGTDTFTYEVTDGTATDQATVTVTVVNQPDPPQAVDDAVAVGHNTPTTLDLVSNDIDVDGDTLTVVSIGAASDGTVQLIAGEVIYTPLNGFTGTDSFSYTIEDATGNQSSATVNVTVAPGPLPDLTVSGVSMPGGEGDGRVLASWTLENAGVATSTETVIERLWLSPDGTLGEDAVLIRTLSFSGDLDPGVSIGRSAQVTLPDLPGTYQLVVEVDGGNAILEGDETNNTASSAPVQITADFVAEITAAPAQAASGETFTVSGRATDIATGDGEAFEFVTVDLVTDGITRSFAAFTDQDGFFSIDVDTLAGSAGTTFINARHPGVPGEDTTPEATLNVFGMDFVDASVLADVIEGQSVQVILDLENLSDLDISGLDFSVSGADADLSVSFVGTLPTDLLGDATASVIVEIAAEDDAAITSDDFEIIASSDQGAVAGIDVNVNVIDLLPELSLTEGDLFTAILLGQQTFATVEITNTGGDDTGDLDVILPAGLDFLSVVNDDLPSLAPGESIDVTFAMLPDADLGFGQFSGNLVVSSTDVSFELPFEFTTTSSQTGNLEISLVSEKTFLTASEEKVQDATVTVRDYFTNEIVAQNTDADGDARFEDLPAGFYRVSVEADGHDSTLSTVEVLPGRTVELESFMSEQTVSYSWTVEEITVEDRYIVEIESTFTTNVPQPVVVLDPPVIDVFDLEEIGDEKTVEITITNHGLIRAENLDLNLGSHPWYDIDPLIDGLDELDAQSSVTIPVRIVRTGDETTTAASPSDGGIIGAEGDDGIFDGGVDLSGGTVPCSISGRLIYEFPCADYTVSKAVGISYSNVGGNCGTPFTYTPIATIPRGGDGAIFSFVPAFSLTNLCDLLRVVFDCAPLLPLPPHIQLALSVADFLTFGPGQERITLPFDGSDGVLLDGGVVAGNKAIDILDDFDDLLDEVLPILDKASQIAACATAVGNFLGNETLTEVGTAVGDAIDTVKDPLDTINDIVDPLDDLFDGDLGTGEDDNIDREIVANETEYSAEFLEIFDDVKATYRDLLAAQNELDTADEALAMTDEVRAFRDALQDLIDTGELDAEQESEIQAVVGDLRGVLFTVEQLEAVYGEAVSAGAEIEMLLEIGAVVLGDGVWVDNIEDARVQTFINDFFDFVRASADEVTLLTAAQEADLFARDLPAGITPADIQELIETWTERLEEAGAPEVGSELAADAAELQRLLGEFDTAEQSALNNGFATLEDSINSRLSTADDTANAVGTHSAGEACAQVRLNIEQEVALTRQGFQGTLVIDNLATEDLTNIGVTIEIRDGEGNLLDETFFGIFDPELDGITAIDGTGVLAASTEGSVGFTILPSRLAAPDGPTAYTIGGTLSYTENGVPVEADLAPEQVTVLPQPELELDYFQSRDVAADDPFTPEIEDSVPFSLGVRVSNVGPGDATDLSITSAQPEIIENEKGLLVDFTIIGTEINGQSIQPTLLADFGTIAAGETGLAVWKMQSSLQGVFSDYSASFEHVNGLGIEELSLITDVTIRELIQVVDAGLPSADDGLPDFLVNDEVDTQSNPDRVYFSEGGDAPVTIGIGSTVSVAGDTAFVEVSQQGGWVYTKIDDPLGEDDRIEQVLRIETDTNGNETITELSLDNIWRTDRTFPESGLAIYEDKLHLFDYSDGVGTIAYEVIFETLNINTAPVAANDAFIIDNEAPISGDLFADNGAGADSDADGDPIAITAVNGNASFAGQTITLASGATLVVTAAGLFDYDPTGALASLAAGQTLTDGFAYTIADGNGGTGTATVSIDVEKSSTTTTTVETLDDGREVETTFVNGIKTEATVRDLDDAYAYIDYVETFDANGVINGRTWTYDDGTTGESAFANGVREGWLREDPADTFIWSRIEQDYDSAGALLRKTTVYDDERALVTEFVNDVRTSATMYDNNDAHDYESYTDTFDANGQIERRDWVYDDGREAVTTYANGVRESWVVEDVLDSFIWSEIDQTYDSNGDLARKTTTYDDGRVLETEFAGGVRTIATMTDVDDVYPYEQYVDLFDEAGDFLSRTYFNDDEPLLF